MRCHWHRVIRQIVLRGSLHGLLLSAPGSGSEIADVNIIVLLQLLQAGQDFLLNQLLGLGRRSDRSLRLFHLNQSLVLGQATKSIDQNGVRLGDVEADVRNVVGHKSVQDGEDGAFNDIECDNGSQCLQTLVSINRGRKYA
jgi:hypothetical protein